MSSRQGLPGGNGNIDEREGRKVGNLGVQDVCVWRQLRETIKAIGTGHGFAAEAMPGVADGNGCRRDRRAGGVQDATGERAGGDLRQRRQREEQERILHPSSVLS